MSTRRDDKGRRRLGRRRGFAVESLERRELLAAAETFAGPSLTTLIKQAEHGQNTEPAIIEKMETALKSQLQSGPLASFNQGSIASEVFLAEAESLEVSYEQYADQQLASRFPNVDQILRLEGQGVVASLLADNQDNTVGLISTADLSTSYASTISSLTANSNPAVAQSLTSLASSTKTLRNDLNILVNDLGNGSLTLNRVNTTIDAAAEAYRAEVHAGTQVSDLAVSGHADTDINALESKVAAIDQADPSNATTELTAAIKTFTNQVLDTDGLFGPQGGYSKAKKAVDLKPGATNGQPPSIISNVSGTTVADGTTSLSATLAAFNGSPIMGQTVTFTLDGAFAGIAVTNFVGVATLNEVPTTDAIGTDAGGVGATFASSTNFLSSVGTGNLTVNAFATTISNVSGTAVFGGTETLVATLARSSGQALVGQTIISFSVDGNVVGSAATNSSGVATLTGVTSTDAAGTDSGGIVASFAGTSILAASANEGNLVVSQAGAALGSVSGSATEGGTATLTATLTSTETGQPISGATVNFTLDGTSVGTGTTDANGVASLASVATSDAIGTDTNGVVASFAGNMDFTAAANATGNLVVSKNATTLGTVSGTATYGGTASLTATLTNASTGALVSGETINFKLDGVSVGSAVTNSSGIASLTGVATADAVGTDTDGVVASFAGDANNAASANATGNLVVNQAGTSVSSVSGTAALGGTATLTATLTSTVTDKTVAGQTITFTLDGKSVGTAVTNASGVATLTGVATSDAAGTDTGGIVATFAGDTNYVTSNGTGNLTVSDSPATIGSVSGASSFGGTATLTATFNSSTNNTGIDGQTITFTLDGKSVGTAVTNTSGVATLAGVATTDAVGTDTNGVVASFAGSASYSSASGTGNLVVSKAATALGGVSGTDTSGSPAILVATLTSTVTGLGLSGETVSFELDGTAVGTAVTNSSGLATLSGVATTDTGTDTGGVTVAFAGDDDYDSSSGTGNLIVTSPS